MVTDTKIVFLPWMIRGMVWACAAEHKGMVTVLTHREEAISVLPPHAHDFLSLLQADFLPFSAQLRSVPWEADSYKSHYSSLWLPAGRWRSRRRKEWVYLFSPHTFSHLWLKRKCKGRGKQKIMHFSRNDHNFFRDPMCS